MCLIAIQFYGSCGHNSRDHPEMCIDLVDTYCTTHLGPLCPTRTETEEHHANANCERCSGCLPTNHWLLGQFYKYCEQSRICAHEYGHLVTDLERLDHEPDIVLVTPTDVLCPDCFGARRPGNTTLDVQTRLDTASTMPKDFEGLPRISICDFDGHAKKISLVPSAGEQTVFSRSVTGTYNPRASRALTTMRSRIKPGGENPPASPSSSRLHTFKPPIPTQTSQRTSCPPGYTDTDTYTRAPSPNAESMDLSSLIGRLSTAPMSMSRGLDEPGASSRSVDSRSTRSRVHRYRDDVGEKEGRW